MTADLPAAIRALYGKGWTTGAGTPCVLVRDVERVLGEATGVAVPDARERVLRALTDNLGNGTNPHGWRCEHPDRFGPCTCAEEITDDVMRALLATDPECPSHQEETT